MRVRDPSGTLSQALVNRLEDKINKIMSMLAASPKHAGGNPFLYAMLSSKTHILVADDPSFRTAATDGEFIYWCPKFLDSLSILQALCVEKHEGWHDALMHPMLMRTVEYPKALNIAGDFLVNSMVEREYKQFKSIYSTDPDNHPLWNAPLGKPITLKELKEVFKQEKKQLMQDLHGTLERTVNELRKKENEVERKGVDKEVSDIKEIEKDEDNSNVIEVGKEEEEFKIKYTFVDESLLGRTVMDIYKEIKEWYKDLDDDLKGLLGKYFGTDEHIEGDGSEKSKDKALENILKSVGFAKNLRGDIPEELESFIEEFTDPILDLSQFCDQSIKKAKRDGGLRADYTAYKRRFVGQEHYFPRYRRPVSKILVLLDTSGSMSDKEIADGLSELKQFTNRAEIYIVPVDAEPHWNSITKVTSDTDFKSIKIVGRGGTVFDDFFRNYRKELKRFGYFNSILVITDGGVGTVPKELTPPCDVGWVITQNTSFHQHFGRPVYLRPQDDVSFSRAFDKLIN